MAYIPNEGVDMHGDADPGAFSSSNSILCVSLLLLNLSPLEGSSCKPVLSLQARPAAKKIASLKLFYHSLSELWTSPSDAKHAESLANFLSSFFQDKRGCLVEVCLSYPSLLSGDIQAHLALPFPVTRPPILFGNWLAACQSTATGTCEASDPVSNINRLNVIG